MWLAGAEWKWQLINYHDNIAINIHDIAINILSCYSNHLSILYTEVQKTTEYEWKISAVIEKQMCDVYAIGVFMCCIHEVEYL